jgi:hypothetical protein
MGRKGGNFSITEAIDGFKGADPIGNINSLSKSFSKIIGELVGGIYQKTRIFISLSITRYSLSVMLHNAYW